MEKLLFIFGMALLVMTAGVAKAQQIEEQDGTVVFTVEDQSFLLCENNQLQERNYAGLLRMYTANAVENDLIPQYMEVYADQNNRLEGQLDQVLAQQKTTMTPEQMTVLYEPFQDQLTEEQFFKLHILNATSISTLLGREIGTEQAQTLCQTG